MSNKFENLFDPDWSEVKINSVYFHEIDSVRNNPEELEELRQAFFSASSEHYRRLRQKEESENIMIME